MATHECTGCLKETIKGANDANFQKVMAADANLVLPDSICTAAGGRHTWAKTNSSTLGIIFVLRTYLSIYLSIYPSTIYHSYSYITKTN